MNLVDQPDVGIGLSREAIRALASTSRLLPSAGRRFDRETVVAAVTGRLGADGMSAKRPPPATLDEVRRRVEDALASPGGLTNLSRPDRRDAAWLLWTPRDPLAAHESVFAYVVEQAGHHRSTRRDLVNAWIAGFSRAAPRIEEGGREIIRLLGGSEDALLDRWRAAQGRFSLFDARIGPGNVAREASHGPEGLAEVLDRAGLADPLRSVSGYARAVQNEVLKLLPSALPTPQGRAVLDRVRDFLAPSGTLRFPEPETRGAVARAMLAPWLDGRKGPAEARADVRAFLLQHMGDPRSRPEQWREAGDGPRAIMRGWLAQADIELFFDVIADHADDKFPYRRAFWRACLERVTGARIVLGSRAHHQASAISDLRGSYARLRGTSGDQSVILMEFDNLVICEWSHSGKLRAWRRSNGSASSNAPSLELAEYDREALTAPGLAFPYNWKFGSRGAADGDGLGHFGSERSYWQGSAAELLAKHCQPPVVLTAKDWTPPS